MGGSVPQAHARLPSPSPSRLPHGRAWSCSQPAGQSLSPGRAAYRALQFSLAGRVGLVSFNAGIDLGQPLLVLVALSLGLTGRLVSLSLLVLRSEERRVGCG